MGRYSSYGIGLLYSISLKDLDEAIQNYTWGKTIKDFQPEDLRGYFQEDVFEIEMTDTHIVVMVKDSYSGTDIYNLLKDFASITPHRRQLPPDTVEEIGDQIKDRPYGESIQLALKKKYEGFQEMNLPSYLYCIPITVGGEKVYVPTSVLGILIGFSYDKTITEDDTQPYGFLTELLRYRLKKNPLSPSLLAYLSV